MLQQCAIVLNDIKSLEQKAHELWKYNICELLPQISESSQQNVLEGEYAFTEESGGQLMLYARHDETVNWVNTGSCTERRISNSRHPHSEVL